jgi:hypothetical protein
MGACADPCPHVGGLRQGIATTITVSSDPDPLDPGASCTRSGEPSIELSGNEAYLSLRLERPHPQIPGGIYSYDTLQIGRCPGSDPTACGTTRVERTERATHACMVPEACNETGAYSFSCVPIGASSSFWGRPFDVTLTIEPCSEARCEPYQREGTLTTQIDGDWCHADFGRVFWEWFEPNEPPSP